MAKISWKPGTMLYPLPAVMVSCGDSPDSYNIITIAWTGILATQPPMTYISVRPERHSFGILERTREFVINLTTRDLVFATDWCGVKSGRQENKFAAMKLTPGPAIHVKAPIIEEAPIHLECRVTEIRPMGSHHVFFAEILGIQADDRFLNPETGFLDIRDAGLICYSHGVYQEATGYLGKFGFSVQKKKKEH
jgi:flavin reductase (DIM6/NTAB) family NADH-FMN oxidoreductase RutF